MRKLIVFQKLCKMLIKWAIMKLYSMVIEITILFENLNTRRKNALQEEKLQAELCPTLKRGNTRILVWRTKEDYKSCLHNKKKENLETCI